MRCEKLHKTLERRARIDVWGCALCKHVRDSDHPDHSWRIERQLFPRLASLNPLEVPGRYFCECFFSPTICRFQARLVLCRVVVRAAPSFFAVGMERPMMPIPFTTSWTGVPCAQQEFKLDISFRLRHPLSNLFEQHVFHCCLLYCGRLKCCMRHHST